MELLFLLKGMLLGIAIAAPVGPIGVLCIRRTILFGRLSGLFSGLGAAIADTLYGSIAAFGLTFVSHFLESQQRGLRLFGGAFLFFVGVKTFFSSHEKTEGAISHKTLLADLFSTLFLTLSNPMTIFSFLAAFAAFGLVHGEGLFRTISVLLGIFLGSFTWWFLLSEGITLFRHRINETAMAWINRVAGLIILSFALLVALSALHIKPLKPLI